MGAAERQADDPRADNRPEVVHLNEIKGGGGRRARIRSPSTVWALAADIRADGEDAIRIDGRRLSFLRPRRQPGRHPRGRSGRRCRALEMHRQDPHPERCRGHLDRGARRVIVAAPVKTGGVLNIVVGINHELYDPARDRIVTLRVSVHHQLPCAGGQGRA